MPCHTWQMFSLYSTNGQRWRLKRLHLSTVWWSTDATGPPWWWLRLVWMNFWVAGQCWQGKVPYNIPRWDCIHGSEWRESPCVWLWGFHWLHRLWTCWRLLVRACTEKTPIGFFQLSLLQTLFFRLCFFPRDHWHSICEQYKRSKNKLFVIITNKCVIFSA